MEWCPTGDIIGDFSTNPTQNVALKRLRYQLMGINEAQDPGPVNPKNIVKIKSLMMVIRLLGIRHPLIGVYCNGCPGN